MLFLACVLTAVLTGYVVKVIVDRIKAARAGDLYSYSSPLELSVFEFIVGALVVLCVITPVTVWAGIKIAKNSKLSYQEYWNGYEVEAIKNVTTCSRDGSCHHTYSCDPYTVVRTRTVSDGNGGTRTETYTETEYHSCPYTTEEWDFYIDTTLGQFTVAENRLPSHPEDHRWRFGKGIPNHIDSGVPRLWSEARDRIASGNPGPVTERNKYDNYILASQSTILKKNSNAIERYRKAKLLPKPANTVRDLYQADKMYFVGKAQDEAEWQGAVSRFNAALGTEKQADLHLVAVTTNRIPNRDEYFQALMAYWQSPELGDDAISKNALIVVLWVEAGEVVFARAGTGMPVGNEGVIDLIQAQLADGVAFQPDVVLGTPVGKIKGDKVEVSHGVGVLESIVWGDMPFKRACMVCDEKGEEGSNYLYLAKEIQPSTGQKWAIWFVSQLLSLFVWIGLYLVTIPGLDSRLTSWYRK